MSSYENNYPNTITKALWTFKGVKRDSNGLSSFKVANYTAEELPTTISCSTCAILYNNGAACTAQFHSTVLYYTNFKWLGANRLQDACTPSKLLSSAPIDSPAPTSVCTADIKIQIVARNHRHNFNLPPSA